MHLTYYRTIHKSLILIFMYYNKLKMSQYMKSSYQYTKLRKNFGREPLFQMPPPQLLDSINPNKAEQKLYSLRNPVHREVQAAMPLSENDSNTPQMIFHDQGINHTEGGWPREVHLYNEDHVFRHRRRVMHDESYVNAVMSLAPTMQHYMQQNNAINMYQSYFVEMPPQEPIEKYGIRTANVFRDPLMRPVSCVVWTNEKNCKLAVSYCDKECTSEPKTSDCEFYLWDIHKQTEPINILKPELPCWQLACSPTDPEILVGGLKDGTVNLFDIRQGSTAISKSSVYSSHQCPVTSLLYIHSRTNTEFFTGSPDGKCLWWDSRNLAKPTDQLLMSVNLPTGAEPNMSNAESVSSLEYDRGLPTKFLCGTDSGLVINVNRMGRQHSEVISSYWNAHCGSVHSVHRSPCTLRMFMTCGDWSVRIWSEEVRTTPIIVTKPYQHQVTDATWAPQRYSCYMVVCAGGFFYYWDFLRKYKEPVATLEVSKHKLTKVSPHAEGQLVVTGDIEGSLYLLQLSENMAISGSGNKQLMFQTYERETRREHILDNRLKEIRLKAKMEEDSVNDEPPTDVPDEDVLQQSAEEEYFRIVQDELSKIEVTGEED